MHVYIFISQLKETLTAKGKPEYTCAVSSPQQETSTGTKRKSTESKTKATKPKQFRTATCTSTDDSSQKRKTDDIFYVRIFLYLIAFCIFFCLFSLESILLYKYKCTKLQIPRTQ